MSRSIEADAATAKKLNGSRAPKKETAGKK